MTKLAKRLSAAAVAGVMAVSLAVSSSAVDVLNEETSSEVTLSEMSSCAATTAGCTHKDATRIRTGCVGTESLSHTIYVDDSPTAAHTENCSYNKVTFTCAYVCKACRTICGTASNERDEQHFHPKCNMYRNGGSVTIVD